MSESETKALTIEMFKLVLPALLVKRLPPVHAGGHGMTATSREPNDADYVSAALALADEAVRQLAERFKPESVYETRGVRTALGDD